jgi:hypothetical protein
MKPVVLKEQPFSLQRWDTNQCITLVFFFVLCFTLGICLLCRETSVNRPFIMLLTFNFSDGCGCSCSSVEWSVDFQVSRY